MVTDVTDLLHDDDENDTPVITKLRRALKAVTKERDSSNEEVTTYKTKAREGDLDSWLDAAKIDKGVKAFVPSDVDSPAALAAWLTGDGSLFARLKADAPAETPPAEKTPEFEDTEAARLLAQIQGTEASAHSASPGDMQALLKKIEDFQPKSEEDLQEFLSKLDIPDGLMAAG